MIDERAKDLLKARTELESLRSDAERYRWIVDYCRSTPMRSSGEWSIIVKGPAPAKHDESDAFDAAIDAARKKGSA